MESLHSPRSQATSGDLDLSYRHAYPHEPHLRQQSSSNYQATGSYGARVSPLIGDSGVERDCLNPQYTSYADAAGGYDAQAPPGAINYGSHQAFQSPLQYSELQSAGNSGHQPTSMTRDSGIELKLSNPDVISTVPRGGADSILNPLTIDSAIQRAFPGFPQSSANQLVPATNTALLSPYPHIAEVQDNVNLAHSDIQSQLRDLRQTNPFDERWLRQAGDMWNLAARRTSRLTISPGDMTPEQPEITEASVEEDRPRILVPERRESRFKALQLFDSSSEDSRQHEELAAENGGQEEHLNQRWHVGQAYARLGIRDQTLDDCTVLITYFRSGFSLPSQIDELREALTAVAEARDSQYLKDFLSSGGAYCNLEDDKERRTAWDAYAAGEDSCNSQSATTVSSSQDKFVFLFDEVPCSYYDTDM